MRNGETVKRRNGEKGSNLFPLFIVRILGLALVKETVVMFKSPILRFPHSPFRGVIS